MFFFFRDQNNSLILFFYFSYIDSEKTMNRSISDVDRRSSNCKMCRKTMEQNLRLQEKKKEI